MLIMSSRYDVRRLLGSGSYGSVHKAWDKSENRPVALKSQSAGQDIECGLAHEAEIMQKLVGVKGVPVLYDFFQADGKEYLAMEYLGKPVQASLTDKPLIPNIAGFIAVKALKVMRGIHNRSILHRDLKPQNILFGRKLKKRKVYVVDFNLSTVFDSSASESSDSSRPYHFYGTKLFCSGNAYMGLNQGRSDDLESLVYVLIWMMKAKLPWCEVDPQGHFLITESKKLTTSPMEICANCPKEVCDLLCYIRALRYHELPDYAYMARLLQTMRRLSKQGSALGIPLRSSNLKPDSKRGRSASSRNLLKPNRTPSPMQPVTSTPILKPPALSLQARLRIQQLRNPISPLCT